MQEYKTISLNKYILAGVSKISPTAGILALTIPSFVLKSTDWKDYLLFFLLGVIIGALCTFPFTYFVGYKRFLEPSSKLIFHVQKIKEKNLKEKIETDHLGYLTPLGYATNDMSLVLQNQIKLMMELANQLDEINEKNQFLTKDTNEKGNNVRKITQQNQEELKKIIGNLHSIHVFVEDLEKQNENIIHVTGDISTENQKMQEITKEGRVRIEETEKSIIELNLNLMKVENQVVVFHETTMKIFKMVSHIKDFANQTNMLALNAGVEAERAGEFGKGFSVVASQVKKLAQESNKASQDIERLIKEIITQSEEMEVTIKKERELSEKTAVNFFETRKKLKGITDYIYESKEKIDSIFEENKDLGKYIKDTKDKLSLSVQLSKEYQIQNEEINKSIDKISNNAEKQKEISENINFISIKLNDTTKEYKI